MSILKMWIWTGGSGGMGEVNFPMQRRIRGWILRITGWIMRLSGSVAIIFGVQRSRTSSAVTNNPFYHGPPWYVNAGIGIGVGLVGLFVFTFSLTVGRRARRHLVHVVTSVSSLTPGSYVLYLRPFSHDLSASGIAQGGRNENAMTNPFRTIFRSGRTYEEALRKVFREFGPLVAVGQPGEQLPGGSGARRAYLPRDDWKDTVRELIDNARLIILGAGPGAGTVWEYVEVMRRQSPHRLVVLVTHPADYRRFKTSSIAEAEGVLVELKSRHGDLWQPPILPGLPGPANPKAGQVFYFRAMIYFGEGWEPHLAYFDRSAVKGGPRAVDRYFTAGLRPVMEHLRNGADLDDSSAAAFRRRRAVR